MNKGIALALAALLSACSSAPDPSVGVADGGTDAAAGPDVEAIPDAQPTLPNGITALDGLGEQLGTADLQPLKGILGAASLVGVGESVHTSGGYYAAKYRLIRFLIEEMGFRVFTMETPRITAQPLADYISTCQGTATEALKSIFGVFACDSTLDLVNWLCQYNQAHPSDPVRFTGFDMQEPWNDAPALHAFLSKAAPADVASLWAGTATCTGNVTKSTDYYDASGNPPPYPQSDYDSCMPGLGSILAYVNANKASLVAHSSPRELVLAQIALASFTGYQDEMFYETSDTPRSFEARDEAMAYVLEALRSTDFPTDKAVVWAHNYHLSERHDQVAQSSLGRGTVTMGTVLKKDLGAAYQAIGLVGYDVQINWPGAGPVGIPTDPRSVEVMLHRLGAPYLLVDLGLPGLFQPNTEYPLGILSEEPSVPADQYRALVYLNQSPPMKALFW